MTMRKRKVYDCVEDWLDALTPDERWRLYQQMLANDERKSPNDFNAPSEIDFAPTLH